MEDGTHVCANCEVCWPDIDSVEESAALVAAADAMAAREVE
jgi:hypothetical protein